MYDDMRGNVTAGDMNNYANLHPISAGSLSDDAAAGEVGQHCAPGLGHEHTVWPQVQCRDTAVMQLSQAIEDVARNFQSPDKGQLLTCGGCRGRVVGYRVRVNDIMLPRLWG